MTRIGHKSAVTCVSVLDAKSGCYASGDESGTVCVWDGPDPSNEAPSRKCKVASDAISAACCDAADAAILYVAHGTRISVLNVPHNSTELSVLRVFTFNSDDVNCLAAPAAPAASGVPMLASADDDGCIALIDTSKVRTSGLRLIRTLRKGHSNICSYVTFTPPGPPPSSNTHNAQVSHLISGGFDCAISVWSPTALVFQLHCSGGLFAHARQACRRLFAHPAPSTSARQTGEANAGATAAGARGAGGSTLHALGPLPVEYPPAATSSGRGASSRGGGSSHGGSSSSTPSCPRLGFDVETLSALASGGQMLNPPFVHACVWAPRSSTSRPLFVTAHGDGLVVAWEWDSHPEDGIGYHLTPVWWCAAHASAATCLAFLPLPDPDSWALACTGNDRVLCLWRWSEVLQQIEERVAYPYPQAAGVEVRTVEEAIASTFIASHAAGKGTPRPATAPHARIKLKYGVNALAGVRMTTSSAGTVSGAGLCKAVLLVGDTAPGLGVHDLGRLLRVSQQPADETVPVTGGRAALAALRPALQASLPASAWSLLHDVPCLMSAQAMAELCSSSSLQCDGVPSEDQPMVEEHVTLLYPLGPSGPPASTVDHDGLTTGCPRVERIVSRGHSSAEDFWYDQAEGEWVAVLQGEGMLHVQAQTKDALRTNGSMSACTTAYPTESAVLELCLCPGQWVYLPAHCKHRVVRTSGMTLGGGRGPLQEESSGSEGGAGLSTGKTIQTIWLAVFH